MGEVSVKKDCFAFSEKCNKCNILSALVCEYKKCNFYKTKKEYREGIEKYGFRA